LSFGVSVGKFCGDALTLTLELDELTTLKPRLNKRTQRKFNSHMELEQVLSNGVLPIGQAHPIVSAHNNRSKLLDRSRLMSAFSSKLFRARSLCIREGKRRRKVAPVQKTIPINSLG
jgi:hypothetical protein